jgi:hypothetical protein
LTQIPMPSILVVIPTSAVQFRCTHSPFRAECRPVRPGIKLPLLPHSLFNVSPRDCGAAHPRRRWTSASRSPAARPEQCRIFGRCDSRREWWFEWILGRKLVREIMCLINCNI